MKLSTEQVGKLERFLERVKGETYPENPSELHTEITRRMMEHLWSVCPISAGAKVLDVGCGQGLALERFKERGMEATGITINHVDLGACQAKGYRVLEMDQSFLDFPDGQFDLIWCRHCLEHSIFPYFTLSEFWRVLKPGGWLYVEVPGAETAVGHHTNKNHYSVLGKGMWTELIGRSGFEVRDMRDINFHVQAGPDAYWAFIAERR